MATLLCTLNPGKQVHFERFRSNDYRHSKSLQASERGKQALLAKSIVCMDKHVYKDILFISPWNKRTGHSVSEKGKVFRNIKANETLQFMQFMQSAFCLRNKYCLVIRALVPLLAVHDLNSGGLSTTCKELNLLPDVCVKTEWGFCSLQHPPRATVRSPSVNCKLSVWWC